MQKDKFGYQQLGTGERSRRDVEALANYQRAKAIVVAAAFSIWGRGLSPRRVNKANRDAPPSRFGQQRQHARPSGDAFVVMGDRRRKTHIAHRGSAW